MLLIQTADGKPIDGHWTSAIWSHLCALLVQLGTGGQDLPTTWGKSGQEEHNFVYSHLEAEFPELQLCELH